MNDLVLIENKIYTIRGQKVILDSDLAELYSVTTFNFNKAVKRNIDRFPSDFMFQLTKEEWDCLIFQFGISNKTRGGRRFSPYVFTEQGVAMLSSILNSKQAIDINIKIMRIFVQIRQYALSNNQDIKRTELEKLLMLYMKQNDSRVNEIIAVLNNLIQHPRVATPVGFAVKD